MVTDNSRGTFDDVLRGKPEAMAAIARRLRALIEAVEPAATEVPRPAEQHIGYGIGSNQRTDVFGYICPMASYVRLGFYYGGGLPDPDGLLVGTGKRLRHVKLSSLAEAERPAIRRLVAAAVRERKAAQGRS